jgi:hypothetical protein
VEGNSLANNEVEARGCKQFIELLGRVESASTDETRRTTQS